MGLKTVSSRFHNSGIETSHLKGYHNTMKRISGFSILQLVMGLILVVFGYMLNEGEGILENAPLVFCVVPGTVIIFGALLNSITFKRDWIYPILMILCCVIGYGAVYYMKGFELSNSNIIVMAIIGALTALISTLFQLLNVMKK